MTSAFWALPSGLESFRPAFSVEAIFISSKLFQTGNPTFFHWTQSATKTHLTGPFRSKPLCLFPVEILNRMGSPVTQYRSFKLFVNHV